MEILIHQREGQSSEDRHFTNISVEIRVQPSNVDGFLGLLGDLGGILVKDVKPKHPHVNLLSQAQKSVDEVAPPSQIPGLNLTQFNEIGAFKIRQVCSYMNNHATLVLISLLVVSSLISTKEIGCLGMINFHR